MIAITKHVPPLKFLQIQKKQLIDLQEHLERHCSVLPIFGFNSAKYDRNLIKSYLLPIIVNKRSIEPNVIKTANQFISFKFGDIQILQRQKDSSPTNGLITPTKCRIQYFLRMMLSTVNFAAATLSKPNTRTMLTC